MSYDREEKKSKWDKWNLKDVLRIDKSLVSRACVLSVNRKQLKDQE